MQVENNFISNLKNNVKLLYYPKNEFCVVIDEDIKNKSSIFTSLKQCRDIQKNTLTLCEDLINNIDFDTFKLLYYYNQLPFSKKFELCYDLEKRFSNKVLKKNIFDIIRERRVQRYE